MSSLESAAKSQCHLFDYHGTLVDNYHHQVGILVQFFDAIGITDYRPEHIFTEDILRKASDGRDFLNKIFTALNLKVEDQKLEEYLKILRAISLDTRPGLVEGTVEYLTKLQAVNKDVGIVTNCADEWLQKWINQVGLNDLIPRENIFSLPRNNNGRFKKPSPYLYQRAISAMGSPPRETITCYEDTTRGIISATRAQVEHIVAVLQSAFLTERELLSIGATSACKNFTAMIPLI